MLCPQRTHFILSFPPFVALITSQSCNPDSIPRPGSASCRIFPSVHHIRGIVGCFSPMSCANNRFPAYSRPWLPSLKIELYGFLLFQRCMNASVSISGTTCTCFSLSGVASQMQMPLVKYRFPPGVSINAPSHAGVLIQFKSLYCIQPSSFTKPVNTGTQWWRFKFDHFQHVDLASSVCRF